MDKEPSQSSQLPTPAPEQLAQLKSLLILRYKQCSMRKGKVKMTERELDSLYSVISWAEQQVVHITQQDQDSPPSLNETEQST